MPRQQCRKYRRNFADRRVSCNSASMDVDLEFNTPFSGVVYPDNQWKEECRWLGTRSRQLVVTIPLNTDASPRASQPFCGVQLDEVPNPDHSQVPTANHFFCTSHKRWRPAELKVRLPLTSLPLSGSHSPPNPDLKADTDARQMRKARKR